MAAHEFGLMPAPPLPGQRYDTYTPEKYACIRVEDACIETAAGEEKWIIHFGI